MQGGFSHPFLIYERGRPLGTSAQSAEHQAQTAGIQRAVKMPYYSDEEVAAMTPQQQQVDAGLILQYMFAKGMFTLWAGKMQNDPRIWLAWHWFNVDEQGRNDIADEQQRPWDRMGEIEVEATNRRAKSCEDAVSIIVAGMGFERVSSIEPASSNSSMWWETLFSGSSMIRANSSGL